MSMATPAKTILVIDDDDITRAGFSLVLREKGYKVELAGNGEEALAYLRDHPAPDLIVLDMLMEGMDGWRFLKQREVEWPSVPFLILTALGIASNEWARSLGACGWLHKPIDLQVLMEEVASASGRTSQSHE